MNLGKGPQIKMCGLNTYKFIIFSLFYKNKYLVICFCMQTKLK
jgi:hypothetical protein